MSISFETRRVTPAVEGPRFALWRSMIGTLERRVTVAVTVMLVFVIGGMFWLSHSRVIDAVSSSEVSRLQTSADQLAQTLTLQVRRLMEHGTRLAASPEIRTAISAESGQAMAALRDVVERDAVSQIYALTLLDASGRVVATTAPVDSVIGMQSRVLRLETVTGPVVSPLEARADTVMYAVTAPVTNLNGQRIGYVAVTRRFAANPESPSLLGGLVGRGARVLVGNTDGSIMSDLARVVREEADDQVLSTSALVQETPWKVVVQAPRAGVLSAVREFTRETAVVGILFIVLGAALSWILIRRTMRPLGEVTDAARDIAAGNLSRRAAVRGQSEIAVLGDAFNQMVERVDRSNQDLAARAAQLETSNKELNESEARYRTLFEHLPDGILVHRENRILFANPAAKRILGVNGTGDLTDRRVLDFVLPADRDAVRARIERVERHGEPAPMVELRVQRADRKLGTVESMSVPLRVDDAPAVQTILHDVSERRMLEEQFRQSQKMDAVGRLAGGVAHDFNNLLTVIQAHAEFAMSSTESEEDRRRDIEEIRKTAENAARLTRQLLTFSRKQSVTPIHLDLNDAISGMLGMIRRLIGDNIEVVTVAGENLACIWADPGQIQQVILNLAVNARDAMPDGGVLRFETANIQVGEGYMGAASVSIPPGDYVMLAVQDTGVGMSEEVRTRVFEPFFTTKQPGRGTGLGLSTVYGIVKQASGHIWVYSEPGIGTAFKVFFPPHRSDELRASGPEVTVAEPANASGHLLVVEDDVSVRSAMVRALRGAGYAVTEASNAHEAIETIRNNGRIDLMITDMVMPGKPGITLLSEARAHRPGLPAIVLSGYSEQVGNDLWRVPDHAVFVEKPVSPGDLIRRVAQLLARS
jgi:PAS domain S-box-containing protein